MKPRMILTALSIVLYLGVSAAGQTEKSSQGKTPEPSIRDLAWLIGRWEFTDRSVGGASDYEEKGTRRCEWALDNHYIRCESTGTSRGKTRTYVFYFNWNGLDQRFEMTAMHGGWPRKTFYAVKVSEDGRRLDLLNERTTRNGVSSQSWATAVFDGRDKMVWETRVNRGDQPPDMWPVLYRDESRRISVEPNPK